MSFDKAFARTVGIEGGYSNDPDDSGGETNWGITKATAVAYGYTGPMRDMPRETAHGIYLNGWWRCLLYTSPSPRDRTRSRMPSSA